MGKHPEEGWYTATENMLYLPLRASDIIDDAMLTTCIMAHRNTLQNKHHLVIDNAEHLESVFYTTPEHTAYATLREIVSSTSPHIQSLDYGPKGRFHFSHREKTEDIIETLFNLNQHLSLCNPSNPNGDNIFTPFNLDKYTDKIHEDKSRTSLKNILRYDIYVSR